MQNDEVVEMGTDYQPYEVNNRHIAALVVLPLATRKIASTHHRVRLVHRVAALLRGPVGIVLAACGLLLALRKVVFRSKVVRQLLQSLGLESASSGTETNNATAQGQVIAYYICNPLHCCHGIAPSGSSGKTHTELHHEWNVNEVGGLGMGGSGKSSKGKVCVVGGGVAGCGAAAALHRSGFDVQLWEKKPTIGGNGKTMAWDVDGKKVTTGLSVLAWPEELFHTYNCLVDRLGVKSESHDLRYFITERHAQGLECVFAHGRDQDDVGWSKPQWLRDDLERWAALAAFVRKVNRFFQPSEYPSMYRSNMLNPLNVIGLKTMFRWYGISERFWRCVFIPVHSSTFLELEMEGVPAVIAELLDDIVPLVETPRLKSWSTDISEVFRKMTAPFKEGVHTSRAVETVRFVQEADTMKAIVVDEDGKEEYFDKVIFACPAPPILNALHGEAAAAPDAWKPSWPLERFKHWLEAKCLSKVMFSYQRDPTFKMGLAHSEAHAVCPAQWKDEILSHYCNYVEVDSTKAGPAPHLPYVENTFVISSWCPPAQTPEVKGKRAMLVSYNCREKLEKEPTERPVTSFEAHPCLTKFHLAASNLLWPLLQGSRGGSVYFCGSTVTPGNGHDLSLLSGLVAAAECGAEFQFQDDAKAAGDFSKLRRMMMWH
jgi:predicted NAD/FAD-dependent oxidoreductase